MNTRFAYLLALALIGCTSDDSGGGAPCDDNTPCADPARPFCDLSGEHPASQGVPNTCIPDPNGNDPDAAPGSPDAATPDAGMEQLRSGVVAVTEVQVSNNLNSVGIDEISGAVVSVSYTDLTTARVAPTTGVPGALGDCTVFVYEVGVGTPPTLVDEGTVTVTGNGLAPTTLPACSYFAPTGSYKCFEQAPTPMPAGASWSHQWNLGGNHQVTSTFTIPNKDFTGAAGMVISTAGFPTIDHDNSPLTPPYNVHDGSFGINIVDPVGAGGGTSDTSQVRAFNPIATKLITEAYTVALNGMIANESLANAAADLMATKLGQSYTAPSVDAGASVPAIWSVVAGESPIIQLPLGVAPFDFIPNATETVSVSKTQGAIVDAFTIAAPLAPAGEGLSLSTASPKPHNFPAVAADWTLTCDDGTDGTCGTDGAGSALRGFTLTGITTDAQLTTACPQNRFGICAPTDMPPATGKWAEFTCIGEIGGKSITMSTEDIAAVLGTSPTRVQTRLLRTVIDKATSNSATTILVGHGLVGFTDL